MRRTIYKYPLEVSEGQQSYDVPGSCRPVFVGMQDETLTVWCEIDKSKPDSTASFYVVGTGWDIYPECEYIGSVIDGAFVWHVYS